MKKKQLLSADQRRLVEIQIQMLYVTARLRALVESFEKLAHKTSGKKAKPVHAK